MTYKNLMLKMYLKTHTCFCNQSMIKNFYDIVLNQN